MFEVLDPFQFAGKSRSALIPFLVSCSFGNQYEAHVGELTAFSVTVWVHGMVWVMATVFPLF